MIGSKYLSEVVSLDTLAKDKLNIVKAPTGSGKTYFALTAIPATLTDAAHKVVYLIDTINGREQILKNYNARPIYRYWDVEVNGEALNFEDDDSIVIITYAKFGVLLEKYPDFHEQFEYIICDELHSLINFQYFGEWRPNLHTVAKEGIERAVRNSHTKVIALSATPERIKREFEAPTFDVPIDDSDLIQYETKQVIPYTNLNYLLTTLDPMETGICYVSRISTMKTIEADARQEGLHPIGIWSIRNNAHPLSEEQLKVRKHILDNFEIPAEYNLLIINASSETSLKIKSSVDYVIVHSNEAETQIQVRGRVNSDLSCLYLPNNDPTALTVPGNFLNRPLFREDTDKLCEILNQRNKCGRRFAWRRPLKEQLIECGYSIAEAADFHRDNGISFSRRIQEHMKVLFDLGVAVLVFKYHFISPGAFQFSYLPVDVLLVFIGGTARISVYHKSATSTSNPSDFKRSPPHGDDLFGKHSALRQKDASRPCERIQQQRRYDKEVCDEKVLLDADFACGLRFGRAQRSG